MKQSKTESLLEAIVNTLIGFLITLISSPLIYSYCGIKYSSKQIWVATIIFTGISVARSYLIRRFFNKGIKNIIHNILNRIKRCK